MRREIKINYDKLEELAGKIQVYQSALSKMKDSIGRIWEALGENTGGAMEALTERKEIIEKRIASCEEELEDLYSLIGGYCYDMQAIIPAEDKSRMMTIDRNDIWFNLKSIENTCGRLADLESFAPVSWAGPVYTPFADDEVKEQEERYGELLEEMRGTVRSAYHNRIVDCLDDMDRIYREKIAAFENKDDEYAQKAGEYYWKYSSACETAFDGVEWLGDTVEGITKGAVDGLSGLIDGIGSLLYGTGELLASGIAWLVCTAADGKMPDWAKARLEGAEETVNDILSDPMGLIEGMCQGISDTYEEEGIWYCAGYTAGTIAGTKGIASGLKGVGAELEAKGHLGIWDDVEKGASGAKSWYKKDGSINYPPNNGAVVGTEKTISLKPGDTLGRYGNIGEKSNFVTQTGADASKLSLPPTTDPKIYQEFVVVKEIPQTIQAKIAAWGDSVGGGLQYELPMPIQKLIREGYIVPK